MQYTELFERVYSDDHSIDPESDTLPLEERLAWRVITLLDDRKGFDGWWGNIDPDIQDEIFEELKVEIAALL